MFMAMMSHSFMRVSTIIPRKSNRMAIKISRDLHLLLRMKKPSYKCI